MRRFLTFWLAVALLLALAGCGVEETESTQSNPSGDTSSTTESAASSNEQAENMPPTDTAEQMQLGLFAGQVLSSADGDIHYSYYLPEGYDDNRKFPMMVIMPGYDMMWFGEDSSGSNLNWSGFTSWTKLDTEMIVVSAQLTDWSEKSARQAIELTRYFINNFAEYPTAYTLPGTPQAEKRCPEQCP